MKFSEKLKKAMQELDINQAKVVSLTGKSKGSISQYLSDKQTPSVEVQRDIAVSLGLTPDFFEQEDQDAPASAVKSRSMQDGIRRLTVHQVASVLHVHTNTVAKGLQQGVFPWGYGVKTSESRWVYIINADRFAAIEGVSV